MFDPPWAKGGFIDGAAILVGFETYNVAKYG